MFIFLKSIKKNKQTLLLLCEFRLTKNKPRNHNKCQLKPNQYK